VLDDIAELEAEDREFSTRLLEKDDLLIVEGHANPDEIGRCAIVPVEAVGLTFQNHLFRLRSRQLVPKFALAWLNSEWVRAYWRCLCGTSSGLNTINRTILNAIPVPVPDKEEQRRIIAVINTQKTRICTEEAYRDKLKLQKQGLMHDLLTGKVRIRNA
jgi:type I restriction enzyme S subunit